MKVFMTGGTGFVGTYLTGKLAEQGFEVTVLTRVIRKGRVQVRGVSFLEGDPVMSELTLWKNQEMNSFPAL